MGSYEELDYMHQQIVPAKRAIDSLILRWCYLAFLFKAAVHVSHPLDITTGVHRCLLKEITVFVVDYLLFVTFNFNFDFF